MPRQRPRPAPSTQSRPAETEGLLGDVAPAAASFGETVRRLALGLTAALIVARAYWYGETRTEEESGIGLVWALLTLGAAVLAVLGMWLSGGLRFRRSWADLAALVLFVLIGLSTGAPMTGGSLSIAAGSSWASGPSMSCFATCRGTAANRRQSPAR